MPRMPGRRPDPTLRTAKLGRHARASLTAVAVLGSVLLGTAPAMTAAASTGGLGSWAMYGDGPAHDSDNRNETVLSPTTVPNLQLTHTYTAWSGLGDEMINGAYGYGVLDNGPCGPNSCPLYIAGFSLTSGKRLWRHQIISNYYAYINAEAPAVSGGQVYIGGTSMYSYNALSGKLVWKSKPTANGGLDSLNEVTVSGNIVYASTESTPIYAYSATTGHLLWSAPGGGNDTFSGPVSVVSGMAYVVNEDNSTLMAYNATTGTPIFTSPAVPGGGAQGGASISNGIAYVQGATTLEAFSASTGAVVWTSAISSDCCAGARTPAVDGSTVVIGTAREVEAFNSTTGAGLWAYDAGADVDFATPAIANGVVYDDYAYATGTSFGALQAFNETSGQVLFSSPQGTELGDNPSVSQGSVYTESPACLAYCVTAYSI
jgi:outer membrane protein assembly factor BamB